MGFAWRQLKSLGGVMVEVKWTYCYKRPLKNDDSLGKDVKVAQHCRGFFFLLDDFSSAFPMFAW
jgi:hypothetical protein